MVSGLCCPSCGEQYSPTADEPWRCLECEHALDFQQSSHAKTGSKENIDANKGVWAFSDFIPVAKAVSFGEGFTPEVGADRWDATFKLDYLFPSASFKDRGTTTMLSRALELDVEKIIDDSSGNAGSSIALYAARAGLDVDIYVPTSAPDAKVSAISQVGANVIPIDGSREKVMEACIAAARENDDWYASHCWRPSFLAGTQTFALEVAYQRNWETPDAVILPTGAGTLFLGAYYGFKELYERGWTTKMPRLLAAQAAGFAPLADRLHGGTDDTNSVAKGLHVDTAPRLEEMSNALDETDGDAIAITESETKNALKELHQAGFYAETTSAVAPAAFDRFRANGTLNPDDDVVIALSGSGLNG